jgi:hypothetical protein
MHRLHVEIPQIEWRDGTMPVPIDEDQDWNPWKRQPGDWSFDIEVPVDGGATVLRPDAPLDIDGTPFVLKEVVIGHSAVRLRLTYDDPGATWSLIGDIHHDGGTYPFALQSLGETGVAEIQTDGGTDHPSGDWTITIRAADRGTADGPEHRIEGNWQIDLPAP